MFKGKRERQLHWRLWVFCLILAAIYSLTVVLSEFSGVPISGFYSFVVTGSHWAIVALCTFGLIGLISVNKIVFSILFPLLMLISGVMVYFNLTTGTRLTALSIELAMVNDQTMWWSVMSVGLAISIVVSLCIGAFVAIVRWKYVFSTRLESIIIAAIGIILTLTPIIFVPRLSAPVGGRLPFSIYFATSEYIENRKTFLEVRNTFVDEHPVASESAPDVILILGEALRADHLPQNGYGRNTMPMLSSDSTVISLPNIYSEYTHTFVSVPHIMTRADSINPSLAYEEQSFVTLFAKAGYRTAWFANQDLSQSYTYFAHECDTIVYCTSNGSFYDYGKWLDADILPHFNKWLTDKEAPRLAVIHSIGSHWWYKAHYTDEQAIFLPDIKHKDIGGLKREEIVNAYDNTIIATDDFISSVINAVKDRNIVVIYISDHGEALGENGVYLHGTVAEPLHYPACLIWFSDEYKLRFPEVVEVVKANKDVRVSTDVIFHTVLDLGRITTPSLREEFSLGRNGTTKLD